MSLVTAVLLGLILAFGARLLSSQTATEQTVGRQVQAPFWRMMLLRTCLIACFAAMYYFHDGKSGYHGYPESVDAWQGAALVAIAAILADAVWATLRFLWSSK